MSKNLDPATVRLAGQLSKKQRQRLSRLRRAFRELMDPHIPLGMNVTDLESFIPRHQLDAITIEQLAKFKAEHGFDAAYQEVPHPSSGYKDGRDIRRDLQKLEDEGIL